MSAGIRAPKDLEGRRVVVNRGYTVTTGLWVRGILKSEYGVDLGKVTWMPTDEEHVAEYRAPANVDYAWRGKASGELLLSGARTPGSAISKLTSPDDPRRSSPRRGRQASTTTAAPASIRSITRWSSGTKSSMPNPPSPQN